MNITYLGYSSFRIKTTTAALLTDPYSFATGLHFPKSEADIVTISHTHEGHNHREGIKNKDAFIIDGPGEYEIKNVFIKGIKTYHDKQKGEERGRNTVYLIETEGVTLCHLGDLDSKMSDKDLKEIETTDILFVPVGGLTTINHQEAKELIKKIEPSIVIPMHYLMTGMSEKYAALAPVDEFLNELEIEPKKLDKLNISQINLPEEMEVVVLDRKK